MAQSIFSGIGDNARIPQPFKEPDRFHPPGAADGCSAWVG